MSKMQASLAFSAPRNKLSNPLQVFFISKFSFITSMKFSKIFQHSIKSSVFWNRRTQNSTPRKVLEPNRDWSELLPEMLEQISTHLLAVEDFIAFRGVCTSWRAATSIGKFVHSCSSIPLLMLPEKTGANRNSNNEREFYSLRRRKIALRLPLPEANGKRCIGARYGWLLTVDNDSGEVTLLNPFSHSQIQLPNFKNTLPPPDTCDCSRKVLFITKAALSADPSHTPDFVLVVIHTRCNFLGFWRPGDLTWTNIEPRNDHKFWDVNHYNGKFYAVDFSGQVWVCDELASDLRTAHLILSMDDRLFRMRKAYLVESSGGELLVLLRDSVDVFSATNFGVIRLDVNKGEWKKITNFNGKDAFFVGSSAAISVPASASPDLICNGIYFTDDYGLCIRNMGIYNLEDASIQPFVNILSFSSRDKDPSIWIA